jgi:hypothetical protein
MRSDVLLGVLPPFKGKKELIVKNQSTGDIIEAILSAHYRYKNDYRKIAKFFEGNTKFQTLKNVFDFLKKNVEYVIEDSDTQSVKSPTAIIRDGFCDCKCYALFIGGICDQLNIPFVYRFSSYRIDEKTPQHIFVVAYPNTKNEVWIDPVLPNFNQRKQYTYKIDKTPMALYSISGIGATKAQKQALKAAKQAKRSAQGTTAKKAAKAELKAARKAAGRTAAQVLKKGVKMVAKVAAAPARNSFLLLVKINFANLAVKIDKVWQKAPDKLRNFWDGIGGNINALLKEVNRGKTKKRILGFDLYEESTLGAAPAAAGAAVAAASPIIAKVVSLLKSVGIEPEDLVQIGKDAINTKVQQLVKEKLTPEAKSDAEDAAVAEAVDQTIQQDNTNKTATPNWIIPAVIGGAAVIYFVTRKK